MAEHRIRLRGGWECRAADSPESAAERLILPVRWSPRRPRRLRLTRRFGRPPLDDQGNILVLQAGPGPGIRSRSSQRTADRRPLLRTGRLRDPLDGLTERNSARARSRNA